MDKRIQDVNETYDQLAPLYDFINRLYFLGKDEKLRSWIVKNLNLKINSHVLNLCSGTGLDIPFLLHKLNQESITGVDLSIQMLQQTKNKQQTRMINLVRADIAHLPFRNKAFDAIMVSFCLKITPTYKTAIEETSRVLKNTGRIGVLSNHKPKGNIGMMLIKFLSRLAKINFEIDIEHLLSNEFTIIKKKIMHGNLVLLLVGEKT
jgi:demethylmenaquinone methyltransferase/2-methoxy-6-polyprenyl-1,4-benzoquinol methylase